MSKGTVGLLVFLYCLKTLGWVATTLGVFLALSYLRSWLQSAWKKEIERSVSLRNGENDGEERDVVHDEEKGDDGEPGKPRDAPKVLLDLLAHLKPKALLSASAKLTSISNHYQHYQ